MMQEMSKLLGGRSNVYAKTMPESSFLITPTIATTTKEDIDKCEGRRDGSVNS